MSFNCDCLIHPFQNDPGTSQQYRIMDELLSGAAKIDARTLADLLDYFVQLSQHVNYYDLEGNVGDWQPFFKNSLPFAIASIIRYRVEDANNDYILHNSLFDKKPGQAGLQLNTHFLYFHFIYKINNWHLALKDSGLPMVSSLEIMIRDRLQEPVKKFITYANAAVTFFGIKKIDFINLYQNKIWNIDLPELYAIDRSFDTGTKSILKNITKLNENFKTLFPVLLDIVKLLATEAEKNLEQSLIIKKEELQKKHEPHLALLFAFLNIFRQLQNDLNKFTRRHLDFFYKNILRFKSAPAVPDKAHILFEIQTLLKKYMLKKGLLLKGGKDNNKQEILFELDDEIVVNQTEVTEKRTLFLHNQVSHERTFVEGLYIAPDATKADGVDKDFPNDGPKNFSTLGSKPSKYANPETKNILSYPNARIGSILASPVLLLNEGTRIINITLACRLNDSVCEDIGDAVIASTRGCCNDNDEINPASLEQRNPYPCFLPPGMVYDSIKPNIDETYVYLTEDLVRETAKKGFKSDLAGALRNEFPVLPNTFTCYCDDPQRGNAALITIGRWATLIAPFHFDDKQKEILAAIFVPFKIFKVSFSGEKEWIVPKPDKYTLSLSALAGNNFTIGVSVTLEIGVPAVSYFDKDKLGEDFATILPLVKIEMDDRVKALVADTAIDALGPCGTPETAPCSCEQNPDCCVLKDELPGNRAVSLYHFFRNVVLADNNNNQTIIEVKVCGLRSVIVQNDESLQDVNAAILPFGSRPRLGSNFYIGSKEVFSKNWQQIWVNVDWKNRPIPPATFTDYYKYYDFSPFEDGTTVIADSKFKVEGAVLEQSQWHIDGVKQLFKEPLASPAAFCSHGALLFNQDVYNYSRGDFPLSPYRPRKPDTNKLEPLNVTSDFGFLRMTLGGLSFQHDRYSYVLARYMMALADLTDPERILDANTRLTNLLGLANTINGHVGTLFGEIANLRNAVSALNNDLNVTTAVHSLTQLQLDLAAVIAAIPGASTAAQRLAIAATCTNILTDLAAHVTDIGTQVANLTASINNIETIVSTGANSIQNLIGQIIAGIGAIQGILIPDPNLRQGLPSEPYTPAFVNFSLDYRATADINDIDLIHLYPYKDTYKKEEIKLQPTLFPTFCDEGNLFLGLNGLIPGDNLDILFQLAEATSDSEFEKEPVSWHYLDSNLWKPLRKGFEVLDDATENLTTSGIVKFALPENMTKDNTVMPKNLHWIKASIAKNSKAVSETTGIHPQAMLSIFTNADANDKLRLSKPLVAGSISKLNIADAFIKGIQQPYDSFGGQVPEEEGQFYVRVSETLRHKGRAIQPWDYERLALAAFPDIFKAKCISHSFALNSHIYKNDFPYAPGYVILAVIPDLYRLKAGNSFEPKVPVSIIEKIEAFIRRRISPFVRFRAMNPRYEKINFCIKVQLVKGKDENYYREKLREDLREFLAPWAVGEFSKLTFGQCVYRADIICFLETRDYIDFITDLQMGKEDAAPTIISVVCPDTPRSILVAGDIEVCIKQPECDDWNDQYVGCDQREITKCANVPEVIIDYCKPKRIQINRNG